MKGTVYIAGKMRGVPLFNFPKFDRAAEEFRSLGWRVISPAEMDRERGFDPTTLGTDLSEGVSPAFLKDAILRDLTAIIDCTALALLPGWETSAGAKVELALARFLGLTVINAESKEVINDSYT